MSRFGKSDKSFFWTLMSDLNPGNHPGNTPSDFINRLPEAVGILDRDNYECGLVDIRYTPVEATPPPAPSSSPEPPPKRGRMDTTATSKPVEKGPFFPGLKLEDPEELHIVKGNVSAERYISDIQDLLRPINAQIERQSYEKEDIWTATINYAPANVNQILIFPEEISKALGFNQTSFLPGRTHSYEPVDNAKLDEIPSEEQLTFLIPHFHQDYTQNIMTVNTTSQYIQKFKLEFGKKHNNIVTFLTQLRASFTQDRHIPVNIGFRATEDTNSIHGKSLIQFTGKENEELVIPVELAKTLGFTTNIFTRGDHNSPNDVDVEEFHRIPDETDLYFKIKNKLEYKFPLEEPDDRKLDAIMASVNMGLVVLGLTIKFDVDGDKCTTQMTADDSVKLPSSINRQLGLADDFVFTLDYKHENKQEIAFEQPDSEPVIEMESVQIERISKQLIVTCSAVKNQYFGESQYPVLRILNLPQEYINQTQITFSPILYVPLESDDITQVRVRLLDEFGRLLNFGNNPVQLTLHFRAID